MHNLIQTVLQSDEKAALGQLIQQLSDSNKQYFLRNEILHAFADYCQQSQKPAYFFHSSALGQLVDYTHEVILEDDQIWILLRPWVGSQEIWQVSLDLSQVNLMPPKALLEVRDRYVKRDQPQILEIDFGPFYESAPSINDPRNIGQGFAFLNHYLCSQVLANPGYWLEILFDVLHRHQHDQMSLLINDQIRSGVELARQIKQAIQWVSQCPPDQPYSELHARMQVLGFEPGWGNTAGRVSDTLELLERLLDSPEPTTLQAFVSRIPAIFRVVLISIHGWVGQSEVLGRPETSGQVAYVLDQARSLEAKLHEEIHLAGLEFLGIRPQVTVLTRLIPNCEGTLCSLQREKILGTDDAWILRVPFREFNPKVTQNWISKSEIWPYLESFALDAEQLLLSQLGDRPNLIIGNYSDGNLVAFLLSRRLKATYCNVAHSLEKPKHLFSNLYWQDLEDQYHFSAQFAADLISMNAADFIITASYQEIVGTPESMGQYESYKLFTMPHLYHVVDGIDLFSPKFNRIPPGVNDQVFYPSSQADSASLKERDRVSNLLFDQEHERILGKLVQPEKIPLLAIAPFSPVKNLTGLIECFGRSKDLQARCNLIWITNKLHPQEAIHTDEANELEKMHALLNEYQLHGQIRWISTRLSDPDLGEAYRAIADRNGLFLHFARFEALGRVILEAMVSGLPTFATQFGGALEIIEDYQNGFLINPTDLEETAQKIVHFIEQCDANPKYWYEISERAIQRIQDEYNWQLHSRQLLSLAKTFGFWNYVHHQNREALQRYLEALFYLIYKPRADLLLEQHLQRI